MYINVTAMLYIYDMIFITVLQLNVNCI